MPSPPENPKSNHTPFAIYDETFAYLIGPNPELQRLLHDSRAPFFYSGGVWIPSCSTLFMTSSLIHDADPAAITSAHRRTEITKVEYHSPSDMSRDKVRCPERTYMPAGCASYPSSIAPPLHTSNSSHMHQGAGIVIAAQGTLASPAGLVYIDAKRPHKSTMILNNYHGRPFNSPCDIVTNNYDNSLFFTDPDYGYERGFRPKPQLPTTHLYRFDPEMGSCRVVINDLNRPGGIAFSPDYRTIYVAELGDDFGGTTIVAYDITYSPSSSHHTTRGMPPSPSFPNGNIHKSTPSNSTSSSHESDHHPTNTSTRYGPSASSRSLQAAAIIVESPSDSSTKKSVFPLVRSRSRSRDITSNPRPGPTPLKPFAHLSPPEPQRSYSALSWHIRSPRSQNTLKAFGDTPTSAAPTDKPVAIACTKRRVFAYTPSSTPSGGIACDPSTGDLWLGTEEGVEVWSPAGDLIGKVLVAERENHNAMTRPIPRRNVSQLGGQAGPLRGVSKVAFVGGGGETGRREVWLLGGENVWRVGLSQGGNGIAGV